MSELHNIQKEPVSNFSKLLQKRIETANPHRNLIAEEARGLYKLETIANKLNRGENIQNCHLKT